MAARGAAESVRRICAPQHKDKAFRADRLSPETPNCRRIALKSPIRLFRNAIMLFFLSLTPLPEGEGA